MRKLLYLLISLCIFTPITSKRSVGLSTSDESQDAKSVSSSLESLGEEYERSDSSIEDKLRIALAETVREIEVSRSTETDTSTSMMDNDDVDTEFTAPRAVPLDEAHLSELTQLLSELEESKKIDPDYAVTLMKSIQKMSNKYNEIRGKFSKILKGERPRVHAAKTAKTVVEPISLPISEDDFTDMTDFDKISTDDYNDGSLNKKEMAERVEGLSGMVKPAQTFRSGVQSESTTQFMPTEDMEPTELGTQFPQQMEKLTLMPSRVFVAGQRPVVPKSPPSLLTTQKWTTRTAATQRLFPIQNTTPHTTVDTSTERKIDRLLELENVMINNLRSGSKLNPTSTSPPTTQRPRETVSTSTVSTTLRPTTRPTLSTTSRPTSTTSSSTPSTPATITRERSSTPSPTTTIRTELRPVLEERPIKLTTDLPEQATGVLQSRIVSSTFGREPGLIPISQNVNRPVQKTTFTTSTQKPSPDGVRWIPSNSAEREHKTVVSEINAMMNLWENGPMKDVLKLKEDSRINSIIHKEEIDEVERQILKEKRTLQRLQVLAQLFSNKQRLQHLVEEQKQMLRRFEKIASRVPKSTSTHQQIPSFRRQVSKSRLHEELVAPELDPQSDLHTREAFVPPEYNPQTDIQDTAIERVFVEEDPEFATRRPNRRHKHFRSRVGTARGVIREIQTQRNLPPLIGDRQPVRRENLAARKRMRIKKPTAPFTGRSSEVQNRRIPQETRDANVPSVHSVERKRKAKTRGTSREKTNHSRERTTTAPKKDSTSLHALVTALQGDIKKKRTTEPEILEMCIQMECDFESGDMCNWESSADELEKEFRRHKRDEDMFTVRSWSNVEGNDSTERKIDKNTVFSATNKRFAMAFVKGSELATLSTKVDSKHPVSIRFRSWEATRDLRLRVCCDDFCPFSTEDGVRRGHRAWLAHTTKCPANTNLITFECVNSGSYDGACGLDNIYFAHPTCPNLMPYVRDSTD